MYQTDVVIATSARKVNQFPVCTSVSDSVVRSDRKWNPPHKDAGSRLLPLTSVFSVLSQDLPPSLHTFTKLIFSAPPIILRTPYFCILKVKEDICCLGQ